jgi:hypothetical protein
LALFSKAANAHPGHGYDRTRPVPHSEIFLSLFSPQSDTIPPAMKGLLDRAYRRRLYILASFAILGLQVCAYSALLVLWTTNSLDRHLFSLSHLSIVSQVTSVVSQALAISSLACLTFVVQAVAADRVIRRRACTRKKPSTQHIDDKIS